MSQILVVGRSGQLAQALVASAAVPVTCLGAQDHDFFDLEATRALLARTGVQTLINTAAYTAVDQAETQAEAAYRLNETLPAGLAKVCKELSIRLIHISTDYVFDGALPREQSYRPDDPTRPLNTYGRSKLAGEQAVLATLPEACIVRTSWLMSRFGKNFLTTMARLIQERAELNVVADQWGTPTLAGDLAQILLKTIAPTLGRYPGVQQVSGGETLSWYQVALAIREGLKNRDVALAKINAIDSTAYPTTAARGKNTALESLKVPSTSLRSRLIDEVKEFSLL